MYDHDAFFLLPKESLTNATAKNSHVFKGYYDADTGDWLVSEWYSVCGQVERKDDCSCVYAAMDETKFLQNIVEVGSTRRKEICGQCIAHFFADIDSL